MRGQHTVNGELDMDEKRFIWAGDEKEGRLGVMAGVRVLTQAVTGVRYLLVYTGQGAGISVLVDREGKPLLSDDDRV